VPVKNAETGDRRHISTNGIPIATDGKTSPGASKQGWGGRSYEHALTAEPYNGDTHIVQVRMFCGAFIAHSGCKCHLMPSIGSAFTANTHRGDSPSVRLLHLNHCFSTAGHGPVKGIRSEE
jgi:hypothetical protein